MLNVFFKLYARLFGKRFFLKFNKLLFNLGLRGLGILNYQNSYLTGEKAWLKDYLKDKDKPVVIDVGANVGSYSLDVFDLNKDAFIIAFEPHPQTYKKLTAKVKSDSFKAYNKGVSDTDGVIELYDYKDKDGSSHASLYEEVITDLHRGVSASHQVEVVNLDSILVKENINIVDLLKVDTEGNEFNVLLGAMEHIKNNKIMAIHFEFNEMNIVSRVSFKDFWDLLSSKYNFYRILAGGGLLEIRNYSPVMCEIYAFQNIVALIKE